MVLFVMVDDQMRVICHPKSEQHAEQIAKDLGLIEWGILNTGDKGEELGGDSNRGNQQHPNRFSKGKIQKAE
jgi:hypothetical protein